MLRGYLDLDALLRGKPALPGHLAGSAVQVLFAAVFGVRQQHQHPLGQAAVQVEQHRIGKRGAHRHAAALLGDTARRQLCDLQNLGGQVVFHACGAGKK